jgi:hypothetical protein
MPRWPTGNAYKSQLPSTRALKTINPPPPSGSGVGLGAWVGVTVGKGVAVGTDVGVGTVVAVHVGSGVRVAVGSSVSVGVTVGVGVGRAAQAHAANNRAAHRLYKTAHLRATRNANHTSIPLQRRALNKPVGLSPLGCPEVYSKITWQATLLPIFQPPNLLPLILF